MAWRGRKARWRRPPRSATPTRRVELDRFTLTAIRTSKKYARDVLRYHWDYFASLAQQRAEKKDEIKKSLLAAAEGPFELAGWQRTVDYRFSLDPLSAIGSVLTDPGGRFNIGDIDKTRFTPFAALYLASDHSTALVERFGPSNEEAGLSNFEFALRTVGSYSCVSVSGRLDVVIDLRKPDRLKPIVELIGKFKLPPNLGGRAQALQIAPPSVVGSVRELLALLMAVAWRDLPMQVDIPAGPQIFGQLAWDAGIEGIVYPSVKTGADCIAVFPENLASSSFVRLDDEPPPGVVRRQLDGTNFKQFM